MDTATRDGEPLPPPLLAKWRWFRSAGTKHRRRYKLAESLAIVAAATIPVASSLRLDPSMAAILGAVVLVATAARTTFQSHENWIEFSGVAYEIEKEVALYLAKVPPYHDDNHLQILTERAEELMTHSRRRWASRRASAVRESSSPKTTG